MHIHMTASPLDCGGGRQRRFGQEKDVPEPPESIRRKPPAQGVRRLRVRSELQDARGTPRALVSPPRQDGCQQENRLGFFGKMLLLFGKNVSITQNKATKRIESNRIETKQIESNRIESNRIAKTRTFPVATTLLVSHYHIFFFFSVS